MRRLAIIAALVGLTTPALAQTPRADSKSPSDVAKRYIEALDACDVTAIAGMLDPDVSSIGANGRFAHSKDLYVKVVEAICNSGAKVNQTLDVLRSEVFGDVAFDVLQTSGTAEIAGESVATNQRVTMVLRRNPDDGAWRILHIQTANAR